MANEAFAIAELLEDILLRLPNQDLLLAQRVNSGWLDAITGSIKIQQKLFYKAKPLSGTRDDDWQFDNPLVNQVLRNVFSERRIHPMCYTLVNKDCTANCYVPLEAYHKTRSLIPPWEHNKDCAHEIQIKLTVPTNEVYWNNGNMSAKDAAGSWRDMLISNPIRIINVRRTYEDEMGDNIVEKLGSSSASTVAELLDLLMAKPWETG